ncbi:antitoxin family protein [Olivibacter domesticus]|uniref:DUF2281 domain-containing protein n=1 Tax=Olivibacter domesticus TaxID=407022 RepID=A0A1H7XXX4_OLID1|nr:antitoxin family protein [Olivibacter domesticus]SEM38806.1 hypothetical protein SAMN05661044_05059 [Olivibacter domesticus]
MFILGLKAASGESTDYRGWNTYDEDVKNKCYFCRKALDMYTAIKGIYENGVLRLLEPAPNIKRAEVVITFLNEEKATAKKARRPGGLLRLQKNKGKHFDIPSDFNDPIDDLKDYM